MRQLLVALLICMFGQTCGIGQQWPVRAAVRPARRIALTVAALALASIVVTFSWQLSKCAWRVDDTLQQLARGDVVVMEQETQAIKQELAQRSAQIVGQLQSQYVQELQGLREHQQQEWQGVRDAGTLALPGADMLEDAWAWAKDACQQLEQQQVREQKITQEANHQLALWVAKRVEAIEQARQASQEQEDAYTQLCSTVLASCLTELAAYDKTMRSYQKELATNLDRYLDWSKRWVVTNRAYGNAYYEHHKPDVMQHMVLSFWYEDLPNLGNFISTFGRGVQVAQAAVTTLKDVDNLISGNNQKSSANEDLDTDDFNLSARLQQLRSSMPAVPRSQPEARAGSSTTVKN